MGATRDRRAAVQAQSALNGIDFVEIVNEAQTKLRVHFLNKEPALVGAIGAVTITGGETIPSVQLARPVVASDWGVDRQDRPLLTLEVAAPGDFSTYTLAIECALLDPYFSRAEFSFKASCPSDLDCCAEQPCCPPIAADALPIDYLAKDYASFRQALSDFSALRYPEWRERSEADFGMVFLEALSALGDDLSYTQDRVAAEAYLETATQRRSIVRHARLVEYEPRPATAARTVLQFDVTAGPIPAGLRVSTQGPSGAPIDFETGTGLRDTGNYPAGASWNKWRYDAGGALVLDAGAPVANMPAFWWDDSEQCLEAGATGGWIEGKGFGLQPGQRLLIETSPLTSADPPMRQIVTVASAVEERDPLLAKDVTHVFWREEDALTQSRDLARTRFAGNLVPATQGRRSEEAFALSPGGDPTRPLPLAAVRAGPNGSMQALRTLSAAPVAWLAQDDPEAHPVPEVRLVRQDVFPPEEWEWRRSLLDAEAFDAVFTLDAARYRELDPLGGCGMQEYDGDEGDTLRFGDGTFGSVPEPQFTFKASYRVGGGAAGIVAADTLTRPDPKHAAVSRVLAVSNPLPADGGADAETDEQVRRRAPYAFRARQYRAVLPADYEQEAQRLRWVQRAGTTFRWTGSWLTVFTTPDPKGTDVLQAGPRAELVERLNRVRLAGYESYVPTPRYLALDLVVSVCVRPDAFRGDAKQAVLDALTAAKLPCGQVGLFHPDSFTFGMPLERSRLEAAIQNAPGVGGVISITVRRRGLTGSFAELEDTLRVAPDQIVRCDQDPSRPERGSLKVYVEGGK